jgi:hypothetical protein
MLYLLEIFQSFLKLSLLIKLKYNKNLFLIIRNIQYFLLKYLKRLNQNKQNKYSFFDANRYLEIYLIIIKFRKHMKII